MYPIFLDLITEVNVSRLIKFQLDVISHTVSLLRVQ
jgi:hypothetical protein